MSGGRRWITGDTSSITVTPWDEGMIRLGVEGRSDVDEPWLDGAWAYLTPASFGAIVDALVAWRDAREAAGEVPKEAPTQEVKNDGS